MQRAYPGSDIRDGVLHFEPRLPAALQQVSFRMQFQRTPVHVTLDHDHLELTVHREGAGGPIKVAVGDEVRDLCPGDSETFEFAATVASGGRETRV
jgi:trehalose/maltose hydrolase-like predicted phosphorylase